MAGISRELTLVDNFSSIWDRFIGQAEQSEAAVNRVEQTISMAGTVTNDVTGATYQWTAAIEETSGKTEEMGEASDKAGKKAEKGIKKATKALEKMFLKFGFVVALLKKVVSLVKGAMDQVNDDVLEPLNKIKKFISNTLARAATSFFKGLNPQLEKVNELLESPAAENFVKGVQVVFEAFGEIAGLIVGEIRNLFQEIGQGLEDMGIDVEELGGFIGGVIGFIYVTVHNAVAAVYNLFMKLIWLLKRVFKGDFVGFFFGLVQTIVDFVLDVFNLLAKAIDWLFGSSISDTLMGWKATVDNWAAENGGYADEEGPRQMEQIEYGDYVEKFSNKGREFGSRLKNLGGETLNDIKDSSAQTAGNTKAIKDALTDEDFKMLIDVATQKFVSNVNLTAQTPVITINGANTGKTQADRRALANTIKYILTEQLASGSTSSEYAGV